MERRNFLGAMLATCAAPAFVKVDRLMRVAPIVILPPRGPLLRIRITRFTEPPPIEVLMDVHTVSVREGFYPDGQYVCKVKQEWLCDEEPQWPSGLTFSKNRVF